MKFTLQRLFYTTGNIQGDFTVGFVTDSQSKFRSFVIEDTYRPEKIKAQTRIPAGLYELKINPVATELTLKHREAYNKPGNNWFEFHIEVKNIPNYQGVYIHSGNDDAHTEGCLLFNYDVDTSALNNPGSKSLIAVETFYKLVYPILKLNTEACFIEVRDESFIKL